MQSWYNSLNQKQTLLLWGASILSILVYGIGLIPLTLLAYLHFGQDK